MGSTIATQGDQIGWLPNSTGVFGPGGLALIPAQAPAFATQNYPRNLHTQGTGQTLLQMEVSGGTPGGVTVIALDFGPTTPGGAFPVFPLPLPQVSGELFLAAPVTVGIAVNDALGNCTSQRLVLPTGLLSGANMVTQSLDLASLRLSTPGALSFL
jgi:hypothetical protein